jgi:hypothetical protein
MAVQFNKNGYTITVETGCNPVENWLLLHDGLLDLLRNITADNIPQDYWVIADFLRDMMPAAPTARKMVD